MRIGFAIDLSVWGGGVTIPGEVLVTDYFANNGATWPNYGMHMLPALYDSASTRTYYTWEAWLDGDHRAAVLSYYGHSTGFSGSIMGAGATSLADDDHGNPSVVLDHEGHLWEFYGSHGSVANSEARVSSTRWPIADAAGEGSLWAIRARHPGDLTYPKPHSIGTKLFVLYRKTVTGDSRYLVVFDGTPSAGEVATWTETTLIDFGANTRVYAGNTIIRGTEIHFCAALSDDSDTIREHVYYYIYDTADGSLSNWDKSGTIASGSLPVDLTGSNTDFRIFTSSGGNGTTVPGLAFDTGNAPHVLFTDGTGTSYALKHMTVSGGAWTSPGTLDTLDTRFEMGALGPLPSGRMEVVYPKDEAATFARGGTAILRRERSAAGTWNNVHTLMEADGNALSEVNPVRNAHTNGRFTWCEVANSHLDSAAGGLRVFIWGTGGLLEREVAVDPIVTAPDGLILLSGDAQSGTDALLTSGDMQSGTDNIQQSIEA